MTTPGGENFQVGDDSVVAKLSVEIPSGSAESLHAINQQTEQLRVNLEAVSRANSSWLEYLQQVPTLTQQAAEAQRDLLTQLERTSYIQQNLGGLAGQTSGGTPIMPQPYSTAAPMGYVNPFQGMTAGMQTGGPQNAAQATQYMQQLSTQNPRVMANMMAQNGMNPATAMGMFGAGITPSGIWTPPGGSLGGGTGPGTGAGSNVGGGAPQPGAGGQPGGGGPGQPPQQPGPGGGQQTPGLMGQISQLGETAWNQGAGSRALAGMAVSGARNLLGGGGGPPGGGGGGASGTGGGGSGTGAGRTGGIIAGVMGANQLIQGAGEQIQQYRNLGGQMGGGAIEGLGLETQARTLALDPSLSLSQSRGILQTATGSGFQGKEFETVVKLMTDNLKNLNMSATDTKDLFNDMVTTGGQSVGDFKKSMTDLLDYSRTGYVRRDEKIAQTKELAAVTSQVGITGTGQETYIRNATEGYADNPVLAHTMADTMSSAAQSDLYTTMAGRSAGITGLPGAVQRKLSRLSPEEQSRAYEQPLAEMAQRAYASSRGDEDTAIAMFQNLASQVTGKQMGMPEAEQLYRRLMRGKTAGGVAQGRAADIAQGDPSIASRVTAAGGGVVDRAQQLVGGGGGDRMDDSQGSQDMGGHEGSAASPTSPYSNTARPRASMPTTSSGPVSVTTHGQVNGTLTVTIDQGTGRASAPPTVRLTGTQTGANAGSGNLNNLQPGQQPPGNGMSP